MHARLQEFYLTPFLTVCRLECRITSIMKHLADLQEMTLFVYPCREGCKNASFVMGFNFNGPILTNIFHYTVSGVVITPKFAGLSPSFSYSPYFTVPCIRCFENFSRALHPSLTVPPKSARFYKMQHIGHPPEQPI